MNIDSLKFKILDMGSGFTFIADGKPSGMEPISVDKKTVYQAWHGDNTKDYDNIDELMTDKFYDGKSLEELINSIELDFI